MSNFFKKLRLWCNLFFHGLFHGLRSADTAMLSQVSSEDGDDQEISHKLEINNVYNDLLREKKTQEEIHDILTERRKHWKGFESKYQKGLLKLYSKHAVSPMKGAYID